MRSISWLFILTSVLCARVAFAAERVSVDMPFDFEVHGRMFPANRYDVILTDDRSRLTLINRTKPTDTISWAPVFAGTTSNQGSLSIQFDRVGSLHVLRTIRLGEYQTLVLDTHTDRLRGHLPDQSGQ
jgi:hypothetical protein